MRRGCSQPPATALLTTAWMALVARLHHSNHHYHLNAHRQPASPGQGPAAHPPQRSPPRPQRHQHPKPTSPDPSARQMRDTQGAQASGLGADVQKQHGQIQQPAAGRGSTGMVRSDPPIAPLSPACCIISTGRATGRTAGAGSVRAASHYPSIRKGGWRVGEGGVTGTTTTTTAAATTTTA